MSNSDNSKDQVVGSKFYFDDICIQINYLVNNCFHILAVVNYCIIDNVKTYYVFAHNKITPIANVPDFIVKLRKLLEENTARFSSLKTDEEISEFYDIFVNDPKHIKKAEKETGRTTSCIWEVIQNEFN